MNSTILVSYITMTHFLQLQRKGLKKLMATRQQNAREFVKTWSSPNKGREDADRQTFWNDLLQRVYGIDDYYNYITYEKDVPVKVNGKVTTRRIDGYIPSTKVLIEMKGKNVKDLAKPLQQSGGGRPHTF